MIPRSQKGKVLIVLHQENSTPARVGFLLRSMGYELDVRRPRFGDPLPETMREHAGAVIFGGPMSANDEDDFIREETAWIDVPLKENVPVLGICLGAQLMARNLGQHVYLHEHRCAEIGYFQVRATETARRMTAAPFPERVYQWHKEGFGLPRGAQLLAEAELFPVQAFQYGSATAIQFHPEVTLATIYRWTTRGHDRMKLPAAQSRDQHLEGYFRYDPAVARWVGEFLENWVEGKLTTAAVGTASPQSAITSAQ